MTRNNRPRPAGPKTRRRRPPPLADRPDSGAAAADSAAPEPEPEPEDLPPWIPREECYRELPRPLRDAIQRVLRPVYRRLVLEADDELARTTGVTLAHLLWLELCYQDEMTQAQVGVQRIWETPEDTGRRLDRHLKLLAAKDRATEMLIRVLSFGRLTRHVDRPAEPCHLPPLLPLAEAQEVREEGGSGFRIQESRGGDSGSGQWH